MSSKLIVRLVFLGLIAVMAVSFGLKFIEEITESPKEPTNAKKVIVNKEEEKEEEPIIYTKEEDSSETEEEYETLFAGDIGKITKDVYLSLGETKENLEIFMDYVTAKDTDSVYEMEINGQILFVPGGTEITVVENDILSTKIKINETGQVGWVPYEYVTK